QAAIGERGAGMSETRTLAARDALRRADEASSQAASRAIRPDLVRIASWIDSGSRVLDLGCGDGTLLAYLRDQKQVDGAGVEFDDARVISAVRRGVRVIQQNLEEGLALFDDQQFDSV